jgi:hypothetical protein
LADRNEEADGSSVNRPGWDYQPFWYQTIEGLELSVICKYSVIAIATYMFSNQDGLKYCIFCKDNRREGEFHSPDHDWCIRHTKEWYNRELRREIQEHISLHGCPPQWMALELIDDLRAALDKYMESRKNGPTEAELRSEEAVRERARASSRKSMKKLYQRTREEAGLSYTPRDERPKSQPPDTRWCGDCKSYRPITEFYRVGSSRCITHTKAYQKRYYQLKKAKAAESNNLQSSQCPKITQMHEEIHIDAE